MCQSAIQFQILNLQLSYHIIFLASKRTEVASHIIKYLCLSETLEVFEFMPSARYR
jgi:hypothetical protein